MEKLKGVASYPGFLLNESEIFIEAQNFFGDISLGAILK
jgi:hypothetical protein